MRFKLEIETGNVALTECGAEFELARLLREAAYRIEGGRREGVLMDYNGATVGAWAYESEED